MTCPMCGLREAVHRPVLLVRAEVAVEPALVMIDHGVCGPCALALRVEDLLADGDWDTIADAIVEAGGRRPMRELTAVGVILCEAPTEPGARGN